MNSGPIAVLDNGGSTIKAGVVVGEVPEREQARLVPNAVARSKGDKTTYFGHELDRCRDFSALHYRLPFEKGYLVDWDAQKAVWDGLFSADALGINTSESRLLITEPYFNLPNVQDVYDQFVFEEYEFRSYYRCTPASLIPYGSLFSETKQPAPECMLIIDSGFSFTHVIPLIQNEIQWHAVKRLDVGGKILTNQLKEIVSYRQWNMMDETYIMNHVKETCCYVSSNFMDDLDVCRTNPKKNPIVREYVLPNFTINKQGRLRQPDEEISQAEQILTMGNERFTIPEILFRPDDIGLDQSGIAATVASSIKLLPEDIQGMFWSNIGLIGGNTKFPGFYERLMSELRSLAPVDFDVRVHRCEEPITEAYHSALRFVGETPFAACAVTRAEYLESGSNASRRKFRDWRANSAGKEAEKTKAAEDEDEDAVAPPPPPKKLARTKSKTGAGGSSSRRR
ncbi:actin-related protein Arp6 [Coniophora puteana RWD-64-598 SS2]|uniref:Actin-like protein ARP6 n=1 Tax=Coniophora puteana (strain RWD-64-598) TaxID=741705 RepID=R7SFY2_CONPW|nr:actin-related protein Arp6 [Coniophora puteana RWD-64-598 SS2]EIW74652.1 actin-related protein Arp6 [Coniophora puteana RWD-64-598 SS2]